MTLAAAIMLALLPPPAESAAAQLPTQPAEIGRVVDQTVESVRLPELPSPTPLPQPEPPPLPPVDPSAAAPVPIPQPKPVKPTIPKLPSPDVDAPSPSQAGNAVRDLPGAAGAAGDQVEAVGAAPAPAASPSPGSPATPGAAPGGASTASPSPAPYRGMGTGTAAGGRASGQPQPVRMTPVPRWLARVWPAIALVGPAERVLTRLLADVGAPFSSLASAIPSFLAPSGEEIASAAGPSSPPPPPADPAAAPQSSVFDIPAEGKSVLLALAIALLVLDGLAVLARLWYGRDLPWHRRWRRRQGF